MADVSRRRLWQEPCFGPSKTELTNQTVPHLRQAVCLAQEVGP
nr:hypothetical protein [Marinobacter nitratireducens]